MLPYLVFNLFVAHVVADFYFQTDESCVKKAEKGLKGWELYRHTLWVLVLRLNRYKYNAKLIKLGMLSPKRELMILELEEMRSVEHTGGKEEGFARGRKPLY